MRNPMNEMIKKYFNALHHKKELPHKNQKAVIMSYQGVVVVEFDSMSAARKATGVRESTISDCCSGILATGGGFEWRLK